MYSKQRNSDGSREAEEQEEHMLLDMGKVVRTFILYSTAPDSGPLTVIDSDYFGVEWHKSFAIVHC